MTEKDISDVELKAAFVSCVFAIVSAATVAEGFDLGRKLCWFTIFNIILSLLCMSKFDEVLYPLLIFSYGFFEVLFWALLSFAF